MALPPALSQDATGKLPGVEPLASQAPVQPGEKPRRRRLRTIAKAAVGPVVRRATRPLLAPLYEQLTATHEQLAAMHRDLLATQHRVDNLEVFGRAHDEHHDARVNGLTVNQELFKADLIALQSSFSGFGAAIAPGVGIAGAGDRLAELRERVNDLERRLRAILSDTPTAARAEDHSAHAPREAPSRAAQSELFDYAGFERRFRGAPAEVLAKNEERYFELLRSSPPVLDIGCGRGELVGLLQEHGIEAYGIDLDANLVAEGTAAGLDVRLVDAVDHLEGLDEGSLGSIISTHVIEHLELDQLIRLIELAARRLRPGGLFIAETPNPTSLVVLGNTYVLDPTHVRPIHPLLMSFLCESAGFREIRLEFFSPVDGVDLVVAPEAPELAAQVNAALATVNRVVFGPQDYAVIARTSNNPTS
jgi:2-polyprenyl-3-methyl-5-hydroxy-6-metoxy-1,4-benzoquinol methylase